MTNSIPMDVEIECIHYDEEGCSLGKKCSLFKHCSEGFLSLQNCDFEVDYEPYDPGSRECAPSGPCIEIIKGEFQGEDIIGNLPSDIQEAITEGLLKRMEEYLDECKADAMIDAYEDRMNDDTCPEYFDGH